MASASGMTKYRRHSAGGQALHHWQNDGKLTTIHIVYEMEAMVSVEALTATVDERLLRRFPRFRGYVSANERHWCVPETVDPTRYVETVQLTCASEADLDAVMQQHVAAMLGASLPEQCSWQVQLVTFSGAAGRCCLLWRIAHTVADGVILAQIMSNVLCQIDDTPPPHTIVHPPRTNLRTPPAKELMFSRMMPSVSGGSSHLTPSAMTWTC